MLLNWNEIRKLKRSDTLNEENLQGLAVARLDSAVAQYHSPSVDKYRTKGRTGSFGIGGIDSIRRWAFLPGISMSGVTIKHLCAFLKRFRQGRMRMDRFGKVCDRRSHLD